YYKIQPHLLDKFKPFGQALGSGLVGKFLKVILKIGIDHARAVAADRDRPDIVYQRFEDVEIPREIILVLRIVQLLRHLEQRGTLHRQYRVAHDVEHSLPLIAKLLDIQMDGSTDAAAGESRSERGLVMLQ